MKDEFDFDFENELAESIAHIVDEETIDAEVYVKNAIAKGKINTKNVEPEEEIPEDEEPEEEEPFNKKKFIIIIASVVAAIIIIVLVAVFLVKGAINKTKDNYGYYQNLAYQAKDVDKDYDKAIDYFEKALTYKASLLKDKYITVDGMSVETQDILVKDMLNLRDCYAKVNAEEEEINILKEVLNYDSVNENAICYLIEIYDEDEEYSLIESLYESVKDSASDKTLSFFNKYICKAPSITPSEGVYGKNQEVGFIEEKGCKIYYTINGKDPLTSGIIYDGYFTVAEGTTEVMYYMVNEYGFASDVVTSTYTISYEAPDKPRVSPASGSYSTSSEQMITIGNIPSGGKAYYTLDGSTPTEYSTEYKAPFAMPEGDTTLKVIVIDENGLSSEITSTVYFLKYVDKYSDSAALNFIWSALVNKNIVDDNHKVEIKDADDNISKEKMELSYYSKEEIDGNTIWMFSVKIGSEKLDYFYGCDANSADVYKITKDSEDTGTYKLSSIK